MSRLTALPLAAACALFAGAGIAAPRLAPEPAPKAAVLVPASSFDVAKAAVLTPSSAEERLATMANQERVRRGLAPLVWDDTLCQAGRGHSDEMAALNYFDHDSPTRGMATPADRWERVVASPPLEYTIGENLFYGSVTDVAWAHQSLMDSPGHRANILNPRFTRVGVGVYTAPDGQMWVTEMFLS
jgi:uncharacterized protein YkwD